MLAEDIQRAAGFQMRRSQSHDKGHGAVAPDAYPCAVGKPRNVLKPAQRLTADADKFRKDIEPRRFPADGDKLAPFQAHDFLTESVRIAGAEKRASFVIAFVFRRFHAAG